LLARREYQNQLTFFLTYVMPLMVIAITLFVGMPVFDIKVFFISKFGELYGYAALLAASLPLILLTIIVFSFLFSCWYLIVYFIFFIYLFRQQLKYKFYDYWIRMSGFCRRYIN
jgi:hypothetical protein